MADPDLQRRISDLEDSLAQRDREIKQRDRDNEELRNLVDLLRKEVERLKEAHKRGKRQAAPFARDRHVDRRKKPGRPVGHPGATRPVPDHIDEEHRAPLVDCPSCHAHGARWFEDVVDLEQFIVDLPPEIRPFVQRIVTQRGQCTCCGAVVRSSHPLQVSQAGGAAKVSLGPRAVSLAADLKHRKGVPYRDIAELLGRVFGLRVTHGALVHQTARLGRMGLGTYVELRDAVSVSDVVHSDETGWRIDTKHAWLWTFATNLLTVYAIEQSRGHDVVIDILGEDFAGTLVSDGLPALDTLDRYGFRRAQCLGHPLRRARDMEAEQTAGAVRLPRALKALLQDMVRLAHLHGELTEATMATYRRRLEARMDELLAGNPTHEENRRLANHLRRHRDQLFVSLRDPKVPPTNNLAEQQLRPAVVTRKRGGCNRSSDHAFAHGVLASVAQTAHRNGMRMDDFVTSWLRPRAGPPAHVSPHLAFLF